MNTLYHLVKVRNEIVSKLEDLSLEAEIGTKITLLERLMQTNQDFPHLSQIEEIKNSYYQLIEDSKQKINVLKNFIDQLTSEIETVGVSESSTVDFSEEHINWQMTIDDTTKNKISSKISHYSDWHYPGLQILAKEKEWIIPMVACDPLYLTRNKLQGTVWANGSELHQHEMIFPDKDNANAVKSHSELTSLEEIIADYPEGYQRRVRLYLVNNRDFSILPQNQFGFVLCWDNFDYLSRDIIQQYLQEVFKLLRPGGIFMFSYTNCELELSALKVGYHTAAYCSSTWLLKVIADIGYELINLTDCTSASSDSTVHPISWAEVRKPGTLSTAKTSQAQGLIRRK